MASFESHVYFRTATLSTSQWDSSPQCTAVTKLKRDIITPDPKHAPTDKESGCLFITQNVPTANKTFSKPVTSSWKPTTEKWRRNIDVRQKHVATKSCATRFTFMFFFGLRTALSDDLRNAIDISSSIVMIQIYFWFSIASPRSVLVDRDKMKILTKYHWLRKLFGTIALHILLSDNRRGDKLLQAKKMSVSQNLRFSPSNNSVCWA